MINPPPLPRKVTIDGNTIVVPKSYAFPEICIFTGSTESLVRVRRKLYWHSPWLYLSILISIVVYVILALCLRKRADVSFSMSKAEQARRRKWHLANWGVFLMTFVSLVAAGAGGIVWAFYLAPVFLVASIIIYFSKIRSIYSTKIDDNSVTIRGIPISVMRQLVDHAVASA